MNSANRIKVHAGKRLWAVIGCREEFPRLAVRDAVFVVLPPPTTKTPFAWCEGERIEADGIGPTPTRVGFDQVGRRFYTLLDGERVTVSRAALALFVMAGAKGQVWCDL